jgi:uroporphyrinogen III methyltransferase/synthase
MRDGVTVYLVGAGPGDVGLLTVRGAELLQRADVIVYDYLANRDLLKLCPQNAVRIYVGKSASHHTRTQDEINALLVEEAEYLRAHNVNFEEVPGITSGIAAPAYAGIPVTHRDFTSTLTLVTGHEKDDDDSRVNFDALANLNGTLVFYMGVKSLPSITAKLIAAGMDPATPAAVVRWGTKADQQTVTGAVDTIVDVVKRAGITAPAITIVGKVVALRNTLDWFEQRPLFGQTVLVTRTRQQASELSAKLAELGAHVLEAPTIEISPPGEEGWQQIDTHLKQLPAYDWVVFTSANGVRAAWERLRHLGFDARHFGASGVAAVGAATARALEAIGIVPDVLPEKFRGEELAAAVKASLDDRDLSGKRFLLLRADIARPALRDELLKMGALVEDVAVYQAGRAAALPDDVLARLADDPPAWVTFTSGSTASNLWELLTPDLRAKVAKMQRVSIGPVTTAALENLGQGEWKPTIVAERADIDSLVQAITDSVTR